MGQGTRESRRGVPPPQGISGRDKVSGISGHVDVGIPISNYMLHNVMGFPEKYTDSSRRLWTLLDDGSHAGPKDVREEQNGLVSVAECRQHDYSGYINNQEGWCKKN